MLKEKLGMEPSDWERCGWICPDAASCCTLQTRFPASTYNSSFCADCPGSCPKLLRGFSPRHVRRRNTNISEHGAANLSTYLTVFRVGDIVDIVANSSEQKGMPHKCTYPESRIGGVTGVVEPSKDWGEDLKLARETLDGVRKRAGLEFVPRHLIGD